MKRGVFYCILALIPFLGWAQNSHPKKLPVLANHSVIRTASDQQFIEPVWYQPAATPGIVVKYDKTEFGFKLSEKIQKNIDDFLTKQDTAGINLIKLILKLFLFLQLVFGRSVTVFIINHF